VEGYSTTPRLNVSAIWFFISCDHILSLLAAVPLTRGPPQIGQILLLPTSSGVSPTGIDITFASTGAVALPSPPEFCLPPSLGFGRTKTAVQRILGVDHGSSAAGIKTLSRPLPAVKVGACDVESMDMRRKYASNE
jgi:hypothetical protein